MIVTPQKQKRSWVLISTAHFRPFASGGPTRRVSSAVTSGRAIKRPQGGCSAVHLFYAWNEAVQMILEEGLTARFERHQRHAAAFREGIKALGLALWAHPEVASPTVS